MKDITIRASRLEALSRTLEFRNDAVLHGGEQYETVNMAALLGFQEALSFAGLQYKIYDDGTAKVWKDED